MDFIERLGKGWHIVLQSFRVVQADKELLVYPVLQGLIILGLGALILIPAIFSGNVAGQNPGLLFAMFLFVAISYFVSAFFQATIVSSASIRFGGKNPTLTDGFKQPLKRTFAIFTWAIIAFFVSLIISALRGNRRSAGFGRAAAAGAAELTWSLITFYVIPIILFEKLSVFKAIGRSSSLFKKTWGEHVTARFTIHMLVGLILVPFLLILFWAIYSQSIAFMIFSGVLFFIALLVVCILQAVTDGILKAALYQYAVKGKVPKVYNSDTLKSLFE